MTHLTLEQQLKHYPALRKAVMEVAYDNGMVNRLTPESQLHTIPKRYYKGKDHRLMRLIEAQLSVLTEEELIVFASGEVTVIESLRDKYGLHLAHACLNDWFEGEST